MKVTGVVRRIDELGRIVIPKEIRRNLRIHDGENMEILLDDDGNIILKRYMVMSKMDKYAQNFTDAINSLVKKNVIITNLDKVIAISGSMKKDYLNKEISDELIESIKRRECIVEKHTKELKIISGVKEECTFAMNTVMVNGDAVGLIIILSKDERVSDAEGKIIKIVAKFLERELSV